MIADFIQNHFLMAYIYFFMWIPQMVVIWNTSRVSKHREMTLVAKAHTDVDISRIVIAPFDDSRFAFFFYFHIFFNISFTKFYFFGVVVLVALQ